MRALDVNQNGRQRHAEFLLDFISYSKKYACELWDMFYVIQNHNDLIFRDPITIVTVAVVMVIVIVIVIDRVGVMSCQDSACTSYCVH